MDVIPSVTSYRIANLTPHPLVVFDGGDVVLEVPPTGNVCRINEIRDPPIEVDAEGSVVPVVGVRYSAEITGLPGPSMGVLHLVSRVAAAAIRGRDDIVFPLDEVRDEQLRIIGCRALGRLDSDGAVQ